MSSLILLLYCLALASESRLLCDVNHDTLCIIHCNMASSCSNMTIELNKSTTYQFDCNGHYSCQELNIHQPDESNNISMLCKGPNSCHSLSIYAPDNNNTNQIIINTFDSCSPIGVGISCTDEKSKCDIFCTKKHIEIYSPSFTFSTQTNQCIDQQFSTSCNKYPHIDYISSCKDPSTSNILHKSQWNIQKHSIPNGCLSSYYLSPHIEYICYPGIACIIDCEFFICNSSSIDATKASSFQLTCLTNTNCSNMDIYLIESSALIYIHPQAENVNLFFADTIEQITNNTSSTTSYPTSPTVTPTYYPTSYRIPTLTPTTLSLLTSSMNSIVYIVSLFVAGIACFAIVIAVGYIITYFAVRLYKKRKQQFISNKPQLFVYYFSAASDIIILFSMYWCVVKAWVTFNPFNEIENYCNDKYWDDDSHKQQCNSDMFCVWDGYKCQYSKGIGALYVMWTMYAVLHFLICICRYCNGLYLYKNQKKYCIRIGYWGRCHSDFCLCCFTKGAHGPSSKAYLERKYWRDIDCIGCDVGACEIQTVWCGYVCDQIVNYGILILFGWIYTELIEVSVYTQTHGIEFYCVLVLLLIKIGLQVSYTFGKEYDAQFEEQEQKRILFMREDEMRMNILINMFGEHTAWMIKQYLPFYYSDECPKVLLLNDKNGVELTVKQQRKKKKRKSGKNSYTALNIKDTDD